MDCKEFNFNMDFEADFPSIKNAVIKKGFEPSELLRFIYTNPKSANILHYKKTTPGMTDIFDFAKRSIELENKFNVVFMVPTGIGCEIGGHAGDATCALKLISSTCDKIITHPNVVNASDINEAPSNSLYVEGSILTSLLMGTLALREVRNNRILVVIENNDKENNDVFLNYAINSVNSARSTLGIEAEIVLLNNPFLMNGDVKDNKAVGEVLNLETLHSVLKDKKGTYDAVAITSKIKVPKELHKEYNTSDGEIANPWGAVEAMLTHFISTEFGVPSAHAPMFENQELADADYGIVDARIAPEIISNAFFHCVLKGLQKSPKIVSGFPLFNLNSILSAKDISALVIPDGVIGLPVLAALKQGIKVIAVKNKNSMVNPLEDLDWEEGQFYQCENYLEASGLLNCLKEGISPDAVLRPFPTLKP